MQQWMNTRLAVVTKERLDLTSHQLSMRHMDLVHRNIILMADSSICFLDWAFAGFYPELFEIRYLRDLLPVDPVWFSFLLEQMHLPTPDEEEVLSLLSVPAAVSERYLYVPQILNQPILIELVLTILERRSGLLAS
ncbi:unnamed protein product [Periconia digitata]|uniref:Protein kinase domain-containing protein n=1 Tax=Periconia digitata TaxID=1303443 RepID=A0A9W4UNH6_9PLEO|nr:unnamed protein product [Periconia digitata]